MSAMRLRIDHHTSVFQNILRFLYAPQRPEDRHTDLVRMCSSALSINNNNPSPFSFRPKSQRATRKQQQQRNDLRHLEQRQKEEMSFGNSYNGGRTRMKSKVILNVYDLSPSNEYLLPVSFTIDVSFLVIYILLLLMLML